MNPSKSINQQPLTAHDTPALGLLNRRMPIATLAATFGLPSRDLWFREIFSSDCRSCGQELGQPDELLGVELAR